MILTCNSCEKKFVVPDSAITTSGRMVQCGSCGNKWKQFPVGKPEIKKSISNIKPIGEIKQKPRKVKKNAPKKPREISLYSPEYLAKKHGIKLNEPKREKIANKNKIEKITFGFYSSLILFTFLLISLSIILYFSQDFIVSYLPASEYYLNYFFESIRNIFEIWKDLITY